MAYNRRIPCNHKKRGWFCGMQPPNYPTELHVSSRLARQPFIRQLLRARDQHIRLHFLSLLQSFEMSTWQQRDKTGCRTPLFSNYLWDRIVNCNCLNEKRSLCNWLGGRVFGLVVWNIWEGKTSVLCIIRHDVLFYISNRLYGVYAGHLLKKKRKKMNANLWW